MSELYLKQTCSCCPEQYDVFDENNKEVGYIHVRHGACTAYHNDEPVYYKSVSGDGMFDDDERNEILDACKQAILKAIADENSETSDYHTCMITCVCPICESDIFTVENDNGTRAFKCSNCGEITDEDHFHRKIKMI